MTRNELKEVFRSLSLAYGQKFEVSTDKLNYWFEQLNSNTFEQVKKNANNHIKNSVFPPTIADLNTKGPQYKPFVLSLEE
ncbi:MAG TPA: replicative helicase loader/inhibitor [Paenisporosarcina sp.]|nr:replicative helicase loader/inhibitor [Paenisporosarcina sp.]